MYRKQPRLLRIKTNLTSWLAALCGAALIVTEAGTMAAATAPVTNFTVSEHGSEDGVDEAAPSSASNGENCLVVWKDNRNNNHPNHRGQYQLFARRLALNGRPLDRGSIQIDDEFFLWNNEGITMPGVAAYGRNYVIAWVTRNKNVSARIMRPNGTIQTNEIHIGTTGTASGQPSVAASLRSCLVAWTSRVNNNGDIYATLLNVQGQVKAVIPVATNSANAQYPVVANLGRNYLVAWRELIGLSGDGFVRAAIVTESGSVEYLMDIPTALAKRVTVGSNGRNYFIAQQVRNSQVGGTDLTGCMLNTRGKITEEEFPIAVGTDANCLPHVLPNGRNFTMLWRENPNAPEATLSALPVTMHGTSKTSAAKLSNQTGWSGYGNATPLKPTSALVVLEQKTPDYNNNGQLSRVQASIINVVRQ